MKELKTLGLWVGIYTFPIIIAFMFGYIFFSLGEDLVSVIVVIFAIAWQLWIYGLLAEKVKYRWRDTLFQFIPIYGIFWTFRICYRTIERWSNAITY